MACPPLMIGNPTIRNCPVEIAITGWMQARRDSARRIRPQSSSPKRSVDERANGVHRLGGVLAARFDRDRGAGPGREHHQAHDRGAADRLADPRVTVMSASKPLDRLHEFRGGAGVQPLLVGDFDDAHDAPSCASRRRSFSGKHPAGDGDVFAAGFLRRDHGFRQRTIRRAPWRA